MTWKIEGLLFENCNCQLICPAHVSFKQKCTNELCQGYWGIHIRAGHYGDLSLSNLNAAVLYESGQRMYEGGWKQACYIDKRASAAQRKALESILGGTQGGPWEILSQFVETHLPSRSVEIHFEDLGRIKRMRIEPFLDAEITAIRGRDDRPAVLKDLFNLIHGAIHVLARGETRCQEPGLSFQNEGSHALYSDFLWEGRVLTA